MFRLPRVVSPTTLVVATLLALLGSAGIASAQPGRNPPKDARLRDDVMDGENHRPSGMVRIELNKPDGRYVDGDQLRVRLISEMSGFAYVFFRNAAGEWKTFYPHDKVSTNAITAGVPLDVPGPGKVIDIHGPIFGVEVIKAVVTANRIHVPEAQGLFQKGFGARLNPRDILAVVKKAPFTKSGGSARDADLNNVQDATMRDGKLGKDWCEHMVEIVTGPGKEQGKPEYPTVPLPRPDQKPEQKPDPPVYPGKEVRRVGVFIGISEYKKFGRSNEDGDVPWLTVAHKDADQTHDLMKQHCRLDESYVLKNQDATRDAIQALISERLPQATRPGDLVIIYQSSHGGQCANTLNDGAGAFRQYLVPFDGDLTDPDRTMILDNTFARWVQNLEGRKVVVILDTCHSGGITANPMKRAKTTTMKSISSGIKGKKPRFFMDYEVDRLAKKINQKDVFVLASSTAEEPSFERRAGDLSVMTYALCERLAKPSSQLKASDLYDHIKVAVPEYIRREFPGATQTPVYGGSISHPPYLRD